ncbi:MAG TPA: type II secretion system protein [Candidatus Dormibacteraeota bacterium]
MKLRNSYFEWETRHPRITSVRKCIPKNNQHGFTLIELLVVISILGILAAVVTMSMVGITKIAQDNAGKTEAQTVQVAYDTMLADEGVPSGSECSGVTAVSAGLATSNMSQFASTTVWSSSTDANGKVSTAVQHLPVALFPHYLRQQTTHGTYYCGANGQIVQVAYNP